jgi:hypothetical protein
MDSAEQIRMIADTLLPGFIPKKTEENELSFHFTLPPNNSYKVWYTKTDKHQWQFVRFEEDERR